MVDECCWSNLPVTSQQPSICKHIGWNCFKGCNYRRRGDLISKNDGNRGNVLWKTAAMILEYSHCSTFKSAADQVKRGNLKRLSGCFFFFLL